MAARRQDPPRRGWAAGSLTIRQLFRDGIRYVQARAAVPCAECDARPDGLCDKHEIEDPLGQISFYRELAGRLGIELGTGL